MARKSVSLDPPANMGAKEKAEMAAAAAMADHFLAKSMQKLPDPVPGVPNFRRVPGYKVYCCGQPTVEGFKNVLEKVCGSIYPKDGKILWLNMRQEPDVYVNGEPVCARPPNKIGEYAELGNHIDRYLVDIQETAFKAEIVQRVKDNGDKLKVLDVNKKESEVAVKEPVKSLAEVVKAVQADFPGLVHMRIPISNDRAPKESVFDTIVQTMVGTSINTPVICSDQTGLSRATTGCVLACLFKEFQITSSFKGLVETVPGVNLELLRMDNYTMNPAKDPLFRGEFPVVKKLQEKINHAEEEPLWIRMRREALEKKTGEKSPKVDGEGEKVKNECDKVIDKNGPAKNGGTGIKQIRENIAESKLSYEIMDDSAQAFLKVKIMDNIEKYSYVLCFTAYMRDMARVARNDVSKEKKAEMTLAGGMCAIPCNQLKVSKSFAAWMDGNSGFRDMIESGKGDLQWEREIPDAAMTNLMALGASKNFRKNIGHIVHDIYQTAYGMFADMPQGDHKKRAKYRFASKTLMRILPSPVKEEIEELVDKRVICMDLYEILGKVTWGWEAEPEPEPLWIKMRREAAAVPLWIKMRDASRKKEAEAKK